MDFSFSDLLDFSKIPIKIFLLFTIVSGLLLFGNDEFLMQLKLTEFEKDYGKFFGIIFIVCISFIALSIIYYFINKIKFQFKKREFYKDIKEEVGYLDKYEQSVLREFAVMQRKTVSMPMDNPVVSGLLQKRIIKRVSNIGDGMFFAMTISKSADKFLKESHLGLDRKMPEKDLREVFSNRPEWAKDFLYERLNK
ncbi:superinfection exclusion B family protein [Tenacibaculum piscium]|uniref:superinfection exclusion B family protein n=1 Tax=Tenacibaculum piscium TaxID=1458515 RepID=UPI00187B4B31|nr:superinfection exclusion B family protein [Tenacibaculum piscium]MBE7630462.1 hypothetical protein [Tenacibaculum piscium]MBE7671623.1 hypothetical protein [Tenacibaculum piscium]